jgi:hypothetical protein
MDSHYSYMADAARDIMRALSAQGEGRRVALQRALGSACAALRQLHFDLADTGSKTGFALRHLEELRKASLRELPAPTQQLFDAFLKVEDGLFAAAGVADDVREFIRREASKLSIDMTQPLPSAAGIRDKLAPLMNAVCDQSKRLDDDAAAAGFLRRAGLMLTGGLTIGINGSVDAVTTLGLAPWMTALSGGFGGGLIGAALA